MSNMVDKSAYNDESIKALKGADRVRLRPGVMFGSDNPIDGVDTYAYNSYGEPSVYKQYFDDLKEMISYEDYENLMDKTARYLFGIK